MEMYELWREDDPDCVVTTMLPNDHPNKARLVENCNHIATILAWNWDEANIIYNEMISRGELD